MKSGKPRINVHKDGTVTCFWNRKQVTFTALNPDGTMWSEQEIIARCYWEFQILEPQRRTNGA